MDDDTKGGVIVKTQYPGPLWPNVSHRAEMIGSPEQWTAVFALLHRDRARSDPAMRRELLVALRSAGDGVWHTLWEYGFPSAVFRAAQEDHFCGCTWEDMVTPDRERRRHTTGYLRWLLLVLHACLHRIMTEYEGRDPYPREREAAVDILEHKHTGLWTALWRVRVPFLDQSTADEIDEAFPQPHSLYSCVMDCSSMTDQVLRFKHKRLPSTGASAHVMHLHVLVWIVSNNYALRMRALQSIATSPGGTEQLLPEILEGPITSQDIFHAFCRDFSDPDVRDGFLYYAHTVMGVLWPTRIQRLESKLERRAFGCFLGAYRRQLCIGDRGPGWHGIVTQGHFSFVALTLRYAASHPGTPVPEAQFYGIVCIIAHWLVPAMDGTEEPWPSEMQREIPSLKRTLDSVGRLFGAYRPPAPALAPLRRHTFRAWQASVAALDARRDLRDLPQWREPLVVWRRLGRFMPADAREDGEEERRGVFERCAWRECGCHVHRPLHLVKVCKGCWLASYCGPRCQASDWENGGHRAVCRNRRNTRDP
ncbi:zinc finger MYND domain-containing protein [Phanerochaete sordida]|uniref:Zinc finger MYND domain-containing protein n=1 Tax=Phanerochaete sordida TaxID=48140 RepID=A0A9P3LDF3_9APHY|nr:zinc finger MYND domain-containing protein [Phanerochaete sordida]